MAASLGDQVLDFGITTMRTQGTHIRITANEPTDYSTSITGSGSTGMLGYKSWGTSAAFVAASAGAPNGRQTTSVAVTDGTIVTSGNAGWWAVTDETNSRLLAHGPLSAPQAVTAATNFNLGTFSIKIPAS